MKTLIVLGGSRGIGASVVRLAAHSGYRIALGYHEQQTAAETITQEIITTGGDAKAFFLDVASFASVESFYDQIHNVYGVPDAVAHCAGVLGPIGGLADMDPEAIVETIATNLGGVFFSVRAAARRMMLSRGGRGGAIVVLSSEAGRFGGNKISPYAASKAGVIAMTTGIARELASEGIRLNTVSPGVIETDMTMKADIQPERRAAQLSQIPLGRMGHPDEVGRAVLWLLSEEASYVTGTTLTVAGGR